MENRSTFLEGLRGVNDTLQENRVKLASLQPVANTFLLLFILLFFPENVWSAIPKEAYLGCKENLLIPTDNNAPRTRISDRNLKTDPITQRSFASFSLDEITAGMPEDRDNLCWFRLDGVWRETGKVALDENQSVEGLASDNNDLLSVTNGTYTTLAHLYVEKTEHPEKVLTIRDGLHDSFFVDFISNDGLSLKEVLQRGGPKKTYHASATFHLGNTLYIDVSRSGRIRLIFDDKTFIRPKPGVSQATISAQLPADDAFLLTYNLENLSASRRGYDVVTQDPFFLLQNPKYEVFAQVDPKKYFITEKRTVPIGYSLIQEVAQGTVYKESLITSETDYQQSVSSSFGGQIGVGKRAAAIKSTSAYIEGFRESDIVSQALGYSRSKQYALVVDHPYVTLSLDFIDAVEDARRYGEYSAIIEKFGTHYPYAVTYGAAAKMTLSFTKESYIEKVQEDSSFPINAGGKVFGSILGFVDYNESISDRTTQSGSIGDTGATFVAVGGNGSWNENGYSAGTTPYPILLDLRPLDELLNPMNFPNEPEIYHTVRQNLRDAITNYLLGFANVLNSNSLLPVVSAPQPEAVEKWLVYVSQTWCSGHIWINPVEEVRGTLHGEVKTGNTYSNRTQKALSTPCKKKDKAKTWKASGQNLISLTGTRSELAKKELLYRFEWRYVPSFAKHKLSKQSKRYSLPLNKNLKVGEKHDVIWPVKGKPNLPQPKIRLRFERVE